ncbi:MAG: hypothetical protein ACYS76_13355, partial [Planctomycetota bacterium]
MGMKKRITGDRTVVARVDESLRALDAETFSRYCETLDMKLLGDLSQMPEPPTIWTIEALKAKHAHLDMGDDNSAASWWNIFRLHVKAVDDGSAPMDTEDFAGEKALTDAARDYIPEDFIRDIAQIIIQLAHGDGTYVPFDVQVGLRAITSNHRIRAKAVKPPAK